MCMWKRDPSFYDMWNNSGMHESCRYNSPEDRVDQVFLTFHIFLELPERLQSFKHLFRKCVGCEMIDSQWGP